MKKKQHEPKFKPGELVTYLDKYKGPEHGRVKRYSSHNPERLFVVFHCGGMWNQYENYTAENCHESELVAGWTEHQNCPACDAGTDECGN